MKICPKCNVNEITYQNPKTGAYAPYCKQCRKAFDEAYNRTPKRRAANAKYNSKPEVVVMRRKYGKKYSRYPKRKEYQRLWKLRNEPEKLKARKIAWQAKKEGRLIPQPCEVCQTVQNLVMHHDDYSKPLEVRWLCRLHHNHLHGQLLDQKEVPGL